MLKGNVERIHVKAWNHAVDCYDTTGRLSLFNQSSNVLRSNAIYVSVKISIKTKLIITTAIVDSA